MRNDYPAAATLNKDVPVVNDKTISYDLLLNVIGRRFHECLRTESTKRPALADELEDGDLIH